jgi:hypothetical protein
MSEASALLAEYRRRADDRAEPYFMSDAQVLALLTEAEQEACQRSHPIFDYDTAEVVEYAIAAEQSSVALDPRVLRVDHAAFTPSGALRGCRMELTGIDAIRDMQDGRTVISSRPSHAAHSVRSTLTLYPAPSVAGTLRLDVYRLPLYDIEDASDEPEIPAELHMGLVDWVLYRVYSTKDSELEDPARAQVALRDFTDRFGERRTGDAQRRHRERRRVTTRNQYP